MDTCSAMTKKGSVMLICDLPKAPAHREHVDQTKQQSWEDDHPRSGGEVMISG